MVSEKEYKELSAEAYITHDVESESFISIKTNKGKPNESSWKVLKESTMTDAVLGLGFEAVAFERISSDGILTGEIVISFKGTVTVPDFLQDALMAIINVAIVPQQVMARNFVNQFLNENTNVSINDISFTGHSLGGALAQYASSEYVVPAVTFNAPHLATYQSINGSLTKNYVISGDTVGDGLPGAELGLTVYLEQQYIEGSEIGPSVRPGLRGLTAFDTHGLDNFDWYFNNDGMFIDTNQNFYREGGSGGDVLRAFSNGDTLLGHGGNDRLYGNQGIDFLTGGIDNDELYGGGNGDFLEGGIGSDFLDGEGGNDTYIYKSGDGADVIKEADSIWQRDQDNISIYGYSVSDMYIKKVSYGRGVYKCEIYFDEFSSQDFITIYNNQIESIRFMNDDHSVAAEIKDFDVLFNKTINSQVQRYEVTNLAQTFNIPIYYQGSNTEYVSPYVPAIVLLDGLEIDFSESIQESSQNVVMVANNKTVEDTTDIGTGGTSNPTVEFNSNIDRVYWMNQRQYLLGLLENGTIGEKIWANDRLYLVDLVLYGAVGKSIWALQEIERQDRPPVIIQPPSETPPAETPPAETPPAETPPAETPPAESPPAETPPAETPPAETPPAETPPVAPPVGSGDYGGPGTLDNVNLPYWINQRNYLQGILDDPNAGSGNHTWANDRLYLVKLIIDLPAGDGVRAWGWNQLCITNEYSGMADPLILDLDGDGIETVSLQDGVYFDMDANGFAEKTSWAGQDDGLLVMDRNGDGFITSGRELFGDQTLLNNGSRATSGVQALAELDTNQDGKIDVNDAAFGLLKVWKDANGDGLSTADELKSLEQMGITSIQVSGYTDTNVTDLQGNHQVRLGSYEKLDGTQGQIGEYLTNRNLADTVSGELLPVPADVLLLPDIEAFGNVYSLQQAMIRDVSGGLKTLVQAFAGEENVVVRNQLLDQILFRWTQSDTIPSASRGAEIDARKVGVLEKFFGSGFNGIEQTGMPNHEAAILLNQSYHDLAENMYAKLMMKTHLEAVFSRVMSHVDPTTQVVVYDLSMVEEIMNQVLYDDPQVGTAVLNEFVRSIRGLKAESLVSLELFIQSFDLQNEDIAWAIESAGKQVVVGMVGQDALSGSDINDALAGGEGNDVQSGNRGDDVLYGQAGDDTLSGNGGNDVLRGGVGNDMLFGGNGVDLLDGGTGNDLLDGGYGGDTYVFGRGYGQDVVEDFDYVIGNTDLIKMDANVNPADLVLSRIDSNLVLSIEGTIDTLLIKNYFVSLNYRVENIQFADGTNWNLANIISSTGMDLLGTVDNDIINGTINNDHINGLEGDDTLVGKAGNDTLLGKAGNDILHGDLVGDIYSSPPGGNDNLNGGDGNDKLYGGNGDDILDGGSGNDLLLGGDSTGGQSTGKDTYIFGRDYGEDIINNPGTAIGDDMIQFKSDVLPSDITLYKNGAELEFHINGTNDKLTVLNYFTGNFRINDFYRVSYIKFTDGTTWTHEDLKGMPLFGVATDENDSLVGHEGIDNIDGKSGDDILVGYDGNDTLIGGIGNDVLHGDFVGDIYSSPPGGNDILKGGDGNDKLYGGNGDDIIDGGSGNDLLLGGDSTGGSSTSSGKDTYIFGRGYGEDIINNPGTAIGDDMIQFKSDVLPSDITLYKNGAELEFHINGTNDKLTVLNYFTGNFRINDFYRVSYIKFTDGTTWTHEDIKGMPLFGVATDENDSLVGHEGIDNIDGKSGDDILVGYAGNDTLIGGIGNDVLHGDIVGDIYYSPPGGNDKLYGGDGDDKLYGGNGDDIIDGGSGNDLLFGGDSTGGSSTSSGKDTYIFGRGYGVDIINNPGTAIGDDIIQFKSDVLPSDVTLYKNGAELEIHISGTNDKLTVLNYFVGVNFRVNNIKFADGTTWTYDDIMEMPMFGIATDGNANVEGYEGIDNIDGNVGDDILVGYAGNDTLNGGVGNDTINGGIGNDSLMGNDGNDLIYGGAGIDVLDGGVGNDILKGNWETSGEVAGNDTYLFGRGYGQDTISDYDVTAGNTDTIQMLTGVLSTDVVVTRNGADLVLGINGTTDQITVSNYYTGSSYQIETVAFSDGTVWSIADIADRAIYNGTAGNDNMTGIETNDRMNGLAGDDLMYGVGGNDTVDGDVGNDTIYGGIGNDTLAGSDGNDLVYGGAGTDVLDGGVGNDTLKGNWETTGEVAGNDTYLFGRDYGQDTISDYDVTAGNKDTIQMLTGILATDLVVTRNGADLVLGINGKTDQITVSNYFTGNSYQIETVTFSDGTVWNISDIADRAIYNGTAGNDNMSGIATNDWMNGLAGDDFMYGVGGNDTVDGGVGNDTIYGGIGNDTLAGSDGNDLVYGGAGTDVLDGGVGNDTLKGNWETTGEVAGNDTYLFGRDYGQDTISDYDVTAGNKDTIQMLTGILATDLVVTRNGADLLLGINGTTDQITVSNYFTGNSYQIETVSFSDGTVWSIADIADRAIYNGTTGNDNMIGIATNDRMNGLSGDDLIYGVGGRDILNGGIGNDTIFGGDENDTVIGSDGNDYLYGDMGNDVIDGGIGNDYVYAGTGNDSIAGGDGDDYLRGENDDDTIVGDIGNDTLYGGTGNDVLNGGVGNDVLYGDVSSGTGNGNDIYMFARGYGQDTVYDYDSTAGNMDTVIMGSDVTPSDIQLTRTGANLELNIIGTTDKLILANYFNGTTYQIEKIQFGDGTVWTSVDLLTRPIQQIGTVNGDMLSGAEGVDIISGLGGSDTIYGYGNNDVIDGGIGTDFVHAGTGNDSIAGGDGDDYLRGENDDDTIVGDIGNDTLYGGTGNDVLNGGVGNDVLYGDVSSSTGSGNDIYMFARGYGQDTIYDYDSTAGNMDTVIMGSDVTPSDIELTRTGSNLELNIIGTTDKLILANYFNGTTYQIEKIQFGDGTVWTSADILTKPIQQVGTSVGNMLYGAEGVDIINGLGGADTIYGYGGNDVIDGGIGNDIVYAGTGNDSITSGDGDDYVFGEVGDDTITGDLGIDMLYGGIGNDVLNGGIGNDVLYGGDNSSTGSGNDIYMFARGYGQDTIYDYDSTAGNMDTVIMGSDVTPSDIELTRTGSNLELNIIGTTDKLILANYFNGTTYQIEKIQFGDGTVWTSADILTKPIQQVGTSVGNMLYGAEGVDIINGLGGADTIYGYGGNDVIDGGIGNDIVYAGTGNDSITSGDGDDYVFGEVGDDTITGDLGIDMLYGGIGNDVLNGGIGNDVLYGGDHGSSGQGNDTYLFNRGYGQDTVYDYDTTAGNVDTVNFSEDRLNLIFAKTGSVLNVSIDGTTDQISISNWSSGASYQTEVFQASNGSQLLNTQVDQLIQAMASFTSNTGMGWSQAIYERPEDVKAVLAQYWSPVA